MRIVVDTHTNRQTDTQNDYCNPRCTCAPRVNKTIYCDLCNTWPSLSATTFSLVQQVIVELSHTIIADTFIAEQQMVWLYVYRKA